MVTVSGSTWCSPPPTSPTGPPNDTVKEVVPLPHEVERGRHDQRAPPFVVDGEHRHVGLAGAGRKHDHASPSMTLPSS